MQARLDRIRSESHALQHRFAAQDQIGSLGESERAIFYSSWMYPAIALACDIPGFQSVDRIAARLHLERSVVAKAVEFLLSVGLCVEQSGEIRAGLKRTHLETGSPLVTQHHIHWRLKALERIPRLGPEELAFSSPLCTSHAHLARIREKTLQFLSEILAEVRETPSETLACLNVDFFSL